MAHWTFPALVDRESYVIPTVGVFAIAAIGAGVLAAVAGIALGGRIDTGDPEWARWTTGWILGAATGAAGWWIRRRWRIHRERRLMIDGAGITYVPFAGRAHLMRWHQMRSIRETRGLERGQGPYLRVRLDTGRFTIDCREFEGYPEIRRLISVYQPGRTTLLPD